MEIQWNSGTSAALKRLSANLPGDLKGYSKALQKKANGFLDHKVANTDMTLRHIISHFIVVSRCVCHSCHLSKYLVQLIISDYLNVLAVEDVSIS